MQTPDKIKVPFASGVGALKSTIPDAGTTTDETASMAMGFPPRTMSTDTDKIAPTGQDFNGILNKITTGLQYLQAGACYKYDSAFATAIGGYPIGAMVLSNDGLFRFVNTVANNTSNPNTGGIGWKRHDIASNGILYTTATGTGNDISLEYEDLAEIEDGLIIGFKANASNTGDVTITINNDIEKTLLKGAENSLSVGDISGAGYMVLAQYSLSADAFIMLNPAKRLTDAVNNRQMLEVFYTFRTDTSPINGAYDCNGAEYRNYDFTGENNPYDMLVAGKAKTCTYQEYDEEVASKGSCAKFALNTTAMTFKVPTLTNILQPTVLASAIGEICDAGLPNITGIVYPSINTGATNYYNLPTSGATGVFGVASTGTRPYFSTSGTTSSKNEFGLTFDAHRSSSIYRDDINTVQPQTIYARAMVQLATAGQEISIEQYEQQLSQYAQTAMLNGRILGETIESLVPLTDAGIHLFDGASIQKSGIYAKFTQYVAGLQASNPELFVTQEEFDASVNAYGVCSKFVNGSSYIRLPKLYSETRYLVKAWKSGTEWYNLYSDGWVEQGGITTVASATATGTTVQLKIEMSSSDYNIFMLPSSDTVSTVVGRKAVDARTTTTSFNYIASFASGGTTSYSGTGTKSSWEVKGYAKETPDSEKIYRYICVATAVKEPTEVVIDNIITDNNNKADKDFANVTKPYIVEMGENSAGWWKILSNGWVEQGGHATGSSGASVLVSFPVEFQDTDYTFVPNGVNNGVSGNLYWYGFEYITGDVIRSTISTHVRMTLGGVYWIAKGWKA